MWKAPSALPTQHGAAGWLAAGRGARQGVREVVLPPPTSFTTVQPSSRSSIPCATDPEHWHSMYRPCRRWCRGCRCLCAAAKLQATKGATQAAAVRLALPKNFEELRAVKRTLELYRKNYAGQVGGGGGPSVDGGSEG